MHVLVIGGTRFVGSLLVWRLIAGGHTITLINRGTRPDPFGDRVERLVADRSASAFGAALWGRRFDAVVDFAAYTASDIRGVLDTLGPCAGHYVFIGSGQVYLVREPRPAMATEADYDGALMARPSAPADAAEWDYGVGKRACEDLLVESPEPPSTRLRLPMISGERDYYRRIESYLWRLLDGGPLVLPDGGHAPTRHVYGDDVARFIIELLGQPDAFGHAYNLAQAETPTLVELVGLLAERLGRNRDALELVDVPRDAVVAAGLDPVAVSPFSGRWMSSIDPARAVAERGFRHRPLPVYLDAIVAGFLAHTPAAPPPAYERRAAELALAQR